MNNSKHIREPFVAGQFYDANPQKLKTNIKNMMNEIEGEDNKPLGGDLRAVIAPHAGYVFSGKTALKTLYYSKDTKYKRAVIIAPSHKYSFKGIALSDFDQLNTPLGNLSVDTQAVRDLLNSNSEYICQNNDAHKYEHSLEVELPLLQTLHPSIEVIPIICGHIDSSISDVVASELQKFWDKETLWIISSDFTHYGRSFNYLPFTENIPENIHSVDFKAIEEILKLNTKGFAEYIKNSQATICGANPIHLLLKVIENVEENVNCEFVDYTTSGALTGDYQHCVSYAGIIFAL